MAQYTYRAVDAHGQAFEDTVEAASAYSLTQELESQGLRVSSIDFVGLPSPGLSPLNRLSWEELRLFSEQLAAITRSGYPLVPSLSAMAMDLHQPRLRAATDCLRDDLERGKSLEEAFREQEHRFPPLYSALVRAGELTGDLSSVLDMMTQHATRMATVKHRVKMATAYPLILVISACAIIIYQLLNIVPVFEEVFGELGAQLPWSTLFLLKTSTLLREHWPTLTVAAPFVALGVASLYIILKRSQVGRRFLDGCLLYFPGLGVAYQGVVQARFCRTFSLLLGARVPMIDAMLLSGAASGSAVLERVVGFASDDVAHGGRLVDALRKTRFFSPSFYWLLGTAEERGQVEEALDNLAESAERNVVAQEQMLGSFITPILTVLIGLVIGFVVVSLYLPIFTLGDQIGGN